MGPVEIAIWKKAFELVENNSKWIVNYMLVNWFWDHYKNYLKNSIKIPIEAEFEANKEIIENIWTNPNKALSLIEKEAELDYKNMAWVLMKTQDKIDDDAEWNIDPDKMKRLKDLSKEYSSDEMQDYIAKILAWEYNKSWTYSLQTMDIIKTLSKEEIWIFKNFKSMIFDNWYISELLFRDPDLAKRFNVNYDDLILLTSLNLIVMNNSKVLISEIWNKTLTFHYNWKILWLKYEWKKTISNLYLLTRAWKELYWLLDNNYDQNFVEYLKDFYKKQWVELIEDIK